MSTTWLLALFGLLLLSSTFHNIHAEDNTHCDVKNGIRCGVHAKHDMFSVLSLPDAMIKFKDDAKPKTSKKQNFTSIVSSANITTELEGVPKGPNVNISFVIPREIFDVPVFQVITGVCDFFFINFTNNGATEFTVNSLHKSLRSTKNSSIVQNVTRNIDRIVAPSSDFSLKSTFNVSKEFMEQYFQLIVEVHYSDDKGDRFYTTVFDQTVFVVCHPFSALQYYRHWVLLTSIIVLVVFISFLFICLITEKCQKEQLHVQSNSQSNAQSNDQLE